VQSFGVPLTYTRISFGCQCPHINNNFWPFHPITFNMEFFMRLLTSPLLLIASIFGALFAYVSFAIMLPILKLIIS
jgi:hypothetical protein